MHAIPRTRRLRTPLAALVALALAAPAGAQQPGPQVDDLFSAFASLETPGCAVGVTRDGAEVLTRGYGSADLENRIANTGATIFEAGSVSKQFTTAAVVLLAQDGKLSLDDDVRRFLPELPEYGAPITIRHLVTHTSGLRDWGSLASLGGWPRTTRTYTHEHMLDIAARQRELNYLPGDFYSYTNTGYNLMAVIVERVSGMPFAEFSRVRLFEPLGLAHTQWRDDYTRIVPGRAQAYRRTSDGYRLNMPFENVHGNGGLLTTVGDLLRWTHLLERGEIAGPEFTREMHRQARLNNGREIEYAGGLFVTSHRGIPEVNHSGSTAGYRAFLTRYPDHGVAVAVLCNNATANATALARGVADLYLPASPASESATAATGIAGPEAAALPGLYRETRRGRPLRIAERNGGLVAGNAALTPAGPGRYTLPGGATIIVGPPATAGVAAFRWTAADGDEVEYVREPEFAPTAAELQAYAGRYHSDEVEATYTVTVEDGTLLLRERFGPAAELTPAYPDAFTLGGSVIRFARDAGGRVTALSSASDRVWNLRFDRVD